jgi:hypothetical protein
MFYDFYKGSQLRVCHESQRILWPWILEQCKNFGNWCRCTKYILHYELWDVMLWFKYKMPLKVHEVNALVPSSWYYFGGSENFRRRCLAGGGRLSGACLCNLSCPGPSMSRSLLPVHHEVSILCHMTAPTSWHSALPQPQNQQSQELWIKTSETWAKVNVLPLLSCYCQVLGHNNTNTISYAYIVW